MIRIIFFLLVSASATFAETIVAVRTIPAQSVISPGDIAIDGDPTPTAIDLMDNMIGKETRVALFTGRPISPSDLGLPAVVERNQIIPLLFERNGLIISTDGRALGRAGPGDLIRVMNIGSRTTVSATIGPDGAAYVRN